MVADTKKVQTLVNRVADSLILVRQAITDIETVKVLFTTANPDITGTPLEGNVASLNDALGLLKTEIDKGIWTALINARVPSHRGEAL